MWIWWLLTAAYVISPVDLIPDWAVPGAGLVDDGLVVALTLLKQLLESRRRNQASRTQSRGSPEDVEVL